MLHAKWRTRGFWCALLALVALLWGCNNSLAPFQPEINNVANSFQLQATNVKDVTTTLNYAWQNDGTLASVNHSTTVTAGTARLVIHDANGAIVYDHALVPSLTELTTAGVTGLWQIQLVLSNYSGTLNFRVQRS
jgi:hypothetical protein